MTEIALGIALFTAIVLGLSLVILAARALFLPRGEVVLTLNASRRLDVPAGSKLLDLLSDADVHLPQACGGAGRCGLCRVAVVSGGGSLLPVERAILTQAEEEAGVRLACQVTVHEALEVRLPPEILGARRIDCRVRSTRHVALLIREIVLELPAGEPFDFQAGAFVQVTRPPGTVRLADLDVAPVFAPLWDRHGWKRAVSVCREPETRAYSLANSPGEGRILTLDVRLAIPPPGAPASVPPGLVSAWLFALAAGDVVTLSGPYGHFHAAPGEGEMVFIGGGAGMAPMRSHIRTQLEDLESDRPISFWYGARGRRDLFYVEEFDQLAAEHDNFHWHVALSAPEPDDDWDGPTGFIHEVVRAQYLAEHPAPEDCEYYLCGPPVMIAAVRAMLDDLGVEPESILCDDFGGA